LRTAHSDLKETAPREAEPYRQELLAQKKSGGRCVSYRWLRRRVTGA